MIKLFSMKDPAKAQENTGNRATNKTTAAQIRISKDINELQLPSTLKVEFPDKDDLQNILLTINPDEVSREGLKSKAMQNRFCESISRNFVQGIYKGGRFTFSIKVSNAYPHEPPKVKCLPKIYHPNIDYDGNVCLNILREDWKPILTLSAIVYGLQYLLLEPNADDPLNKEAADLMLRNKSLFVQQVTESMRGRAFSGQKFDNVLINK